MGWCEADFCLNDFTQGPVAFLGNPALATQYQNLIALEHYLGSQFGVIIKGEAYLGSQFQFYIDTERPRGLQFLSIGKFNLPLQFFASFYNLTQLRILTEFDSRGDGGSNWTASTTATGDFDAENLNSDLVENKWRSTSSLITLDCDTELPQGSLNDTMAILNHNLTGGAQVTIYASNVSNFATIEKTINLTPSANNIFWAADEAPKEGYRYWRFSIDDPDNPDGYIEIGTIVFGRSRIFNTLENFSDDVEFERRAFSDQVETEGFTAVSNDRGQKNVLSLDFDLLDTTGQNYYNMKWVFQNLRTTHKMLVIPYPEDPGLLSVFAKLEQMPNEKHTYTDMVGRSTFSVTWDEGM
jgi:hypothetical protein